MDDGKRFRLRTGVTVHRAHDGAIVLALSGEPICLPAALSTAVVDALLEALAEPVSVVALGASLGADVGLLLETLARLGVVEPLVDAGVAIRVDADLPGFDSLAAAEGLRVSSEGARLVIWCGEDEPPQTSVPVLQCIPWLDGLGVVGPLGACARCWQRRVAAHGLTRRRPVMRMSARERRGFFDLLLREGVSQLCGHAHALAAGQWLAFDHVRGGFTTHAFLHLPGCPHGTGEAPGSAPVESGLVDARSGILSRLDTEPLAARRVPLFVAVAHLGETTALGRGEAFRGAAGVAPTPHGARGKALGEALERYCAAVPREVIEIAPVARRDLGRAALDPADLGLFSPAQQQRPDFPFTPPDDGLPLRWVEGVALPSEAPIMVAAQCVYMPCDLDEPPLLPAQSHGLACGRSREEAIRAGLLELIERDAFMRFWQLAKPRPRLVGLERLRGALRGLLDEMDERGWRLTLLDLRDALAVPVVLAVARPAADAESGPCLWLGAAAACTLEVALERALLELVQNHRWLARECVRRVAPRVPTSFEDHALYYTTHPHLLSRLDFLWADDAAVGTVPATDVASLPHDDVASWLHAHGLSPIVVDLTSAEVRAHGLHVVRTIVPHFVRVHADESWPFLGSPRLNGAVNPLVHPFP